MDLLSTPVSSELSATKSDITSSTHELPTMDQQLAKIQYIEPDTSVDPWDCDYVALPRPLTVTNERLPIHDLRSENFTSSSHYSLANTAITAVKHNSILHDTPYSKKSFLDEHIVSEVYIPELKV
jgi:hypothetical protein